MTDLLSQGSQKFLGKNGVRKGKNGKMGSEKWGQEPFLMN